MVVPEDGTWLSTTEIVEGDKKPEAVTGVKELPKDTTICRTGVEFLVRFEDPESEDFPERFFKANVSIGANVESFKVCENCGGLIDIESEDNEDILVEE